jgi:hypothetical protein
VQGMMSISVEAAAARDSLSDDKELIHTYEVVSSSLACRLTQQLNNHIVMFYLSDFSV